MSRLLMDDTVLHGLLSDLEVVIRTRHEQKPPEEDFKEMGDLEKMANDRIAMMAPGRNPAWQYNIYDMWLQTHDWFLERFSAAAGLKDQMLALSEDNLKGVEIPAPPSRCPKRSLEENGAAKLHRAKKRKLEEKDEEEGKARFVENENEWEEEAEEEE
ncbi:hypothetical protein L218DRAFT_959429 [Marasmius fiardii PR-910]|nr:hypothetical protein L218DRAFT_959429 [Marasmius fiardii PR-910]